MSTTPTSSFPASRPMALIESPGRGGSSRVWVRTPDDYFEISNVVARADLVCDVNGESSLTIVIPYAATGAPSETSAA